MTRIALLCVFSLVASSLFADQVMMRNGDRYSGNVISVTTNTVVLKSDTLGTVNLSRSNVINIMIGSGSAPAPMPLQPQLQPMQQTPPPLRTLPERAHRVPPPVAPPVNTNDDLSLQLKQIAGQTNLIQQVAGQYLAGAGPEATEKFNSMMSDLSTGRMSIDGLRGEAQSAVDQLKQLKKELGDDAGDSVDVYLSVLQGFLNEMPAAPVKKTNASVTSPVTESPH